jgi:hypothetical protein
MRLRDIIREQEEPQRYRVAIVLDGGTIILTVPIPLTALQKDDIEERLRAYIERHKRSYNIPTTDFDVWYPVDEENNRIELPDVDVPDVEIIDPSDEGSREPERNIATPGETKPEPEPEPEPEDDSRVSVELINQRDLDLARAYQQERFDTIDQDRDGVHDDTGETLPQINRDGSLTDPETGEVVGAVAGTTYAERLQDALDQGAQTSDSFVGIVGQGGGADGDTGDEGVEGTEGAVTGEQRAEIPSIIEELRAAMSGPGTSEGRMINALKRIGSPAHLEAVVQMYRQEYGDSLPQDMINEFKWDLGGNNAAQVEEINRIMRPLGWEITGTRYSTMRWQKYDGAGESSSTSTTEESTFQPTNEEREQMADANYIYDAIMSQVDQEAGYWTEVEPIEYTNAEGRIDFIRNPIQFFELPTDREYSAADMQDIKAKIGELFPLISGARLPNPEREEGGPMTITIDTGQFAYTRQLEGEE